MIILYLMINALDENQGITYILLSDESDYIIVYHLYHERNRKNYIDSNL